MKKRAGLTINARSSWPGTRRGLAGAKDASLCGEGIQGKEGKASIRGLRCRHGNYALAWGMWRSHAPKTKLKPSEREKPRRGGAHILLFSVFPKEHVL